MPRRKKAAPSALPAEASPPQDSTAISQPIEEVLATTIGVEHGDGPLPTRDANGTTGAEELVPPAAESENGTPYAAKTTAAAAYAADPCPTMTVNLCGYSGGPTAHLLRSYRFKQMQIRFDHGQPDEQYLAMLRRAAWIDRSESEGVWTKQIDQEARWQSVDGMEKEFKTITNAIRKEKGLEPVLERLALA